MRIINNQRGFTLISLMVGTVLSMLTIIAMLALYKNLVQVAVDATQDANHDGGLASALLTAQLELQSAGFGMEETATDIIRLSNNAESTYILWRSKNLDSSQTSYNGLLAREHPEKTEQKNRTLTLLHQPNCSSYPSATDSTLAGWATIINLAILAPETSVLFSRTDPPKCSNFSVSNDFKHPLITITAMSSSALANSAGDGLRIRYTVCLSNIRS